MKTYKLICLITLSLFSLQSFAFTYYQNYRSPNQLRASSDTYNTNNPYKPGNFANPYHSFWNPYHKKSIYHNYNRYSQPVNSFNGNNHGQINQFVKDPRNITNPYGVYGNVYSKKNIAHPYRYHNGYHTYSRFQNPYNKQSIRHDPKFSVQYYDSNGYYLGHSLSNSYKTKPVYNPYTHSPYNAPNTQNHHGDNKRFQ